MEPLVTETSTSTPLQRERKSSWGDVIAILIIIGILALGAYYVFTDRLSSLPDAQATTMR